MSTRTGFVSKLSTEYIGLLLTRLVRCCRVASIKPTLVTV